eukprot:3941733-Pyramimonas_sp.AAC.1
MVDGPTCMISQLSRVATVTIPRQLRTSPPANPEAMPRWVERMRYARGPHGGVTLMEAFDGDLGGHLGATIGQSRAPCHGCLKGFGVHPGGVGQ